MIGAKATKQAANKAEKTAARSLTPEQDENNEDDGPGTPLQESQGGTTITLALRTPERLYKAYNLASFLASEGPDLSEGPDSPESQAQPPASTAPARIEELKGPRKRRRLQNNLYRESQYKL